MPVDSLHRSSSPPNRSWKARIAPALGGWILGTLAGVTAVRLNLVPPRSLAPPHDVIIAMGGAGLVLGLLRLQILAWIAAGFYSLIFLFVAFTPFVAPRVRGLVRSDPPARCPAVVMLSADIWHDGTLNQNAQDRMVKTLALLKDGYAANLIITRVPPPRPSGLQAVRRFLKLADLNVPVYEVGPARDTHDEAVGVARLAREHGWKEILLVTSPTHTRRAGATFEKTGLRVHVQPSAETEYDLRQLDSPGDRIPAFRDWFKETVGWNVYRRRGWIK